MHDLPGSAAGSGFQEDALGGRTPHHHCPDDAGGFVGQCDRGKFGRFARHQSADPLAVAGWSIACMAQYGNGACGKQATDVFVCKGSDLI